MKTSKFLKLDFADILKGLLMAILTPAVVIIQQSLELGILTFEWKSIITASRGGGLAYLLKNFLTPQKEVNKIQSIGLPKPKNQYENLNTYYTNLHTFIILEKSKIDPAVLENGRLDRMEHHLKLMKESVERTNTEIHKISSALVGNEYTGGIGLVHKMDKLQKDISNNKDDIDILKENMSLVKWFGSAIGGLLVAMIIYILQKAL